MASILREPVKRPQIINSLTGTLYVWPHDMRDKQRTITIDAGYAGAGHLAPPARKRNSSQERGQPPVIITVDADASS